MLVAKSIKDRAEEGDGYRLLVTGEWPAGFPPSGAEGFNPALAPPPALYQELVGNKITFEEFGRRYSEALGAQAERLGRLQKQAEKSPITLVSYPDFEGRKLAQIIIDKCRPLV